jgi:hypothetical protein
LLLFLPSSTLLQSGPRHVRSGLLAEPEEALPLERRKKFLSRG